MDMDSFSVGPLASIFYIPSFLTASEQAYFLHQVNSAPASKWKTLKNRRLQNWGGVVHEKGLIAQSLPPWLTTLTKRISAETGLFPSSINHVLVNEYEPGQGIMPHQDGPLYFPVVAIVSLGSQTIMRFVPHQGIVESKQDVPLTPAGQEGNPADVLKDARDEASDSIVQCIPKQEKPGPQQKENPCTVRSQQCQQRTCSKVVSVVLMPGSLLLFKDSAYQEYLHGIEDSNEHKLDSTVVNAHMARDGENDGNGGSTLEEEGDFNGSDSPWSSTLQRTGTRVSLTCRLVPKVQGKFLRL